MRFKRWGCLALAGAALVPGAARAEVPAPSTGGTYTIENGQRNTFGDVGEQWTSFNRSGGRLRVGTNGYGLFYVKGSTDADPVAGDRAGWRLEAPAGTSLRSASVDLMWNAGVAGRWVGGLRWSLVADGEVLASCLAPECAAAFAAVSGRERSFSLPAGTRALELSAECVADGGCSRYGGDASMPGGNEYAAVTGATVTLVDGVSPVLDGATATGSLWTEPERWFHNGDDSASVSVGGSDGSGIARLQWYVDGTLAYDTSGVTSTGPLSCNFGWLKPCFDSSALFTFDRALFEVPDGSHSLAVVAHDAAGNVSAPLTRRFQVDDSPPPSVDVSLREGSELRDPGPWHLDFTVPGVADGSPLAAAQWQLCNADNAWDCVNDSAAVSGSGGSSRSVAVTPPRRGSWHARLALVDAAGNVGGWSAPVLIRYGESAPVADPAHPPQLSGEFVDGSSVRVSKSGFAVAGTPRYAFQWQRCPSAEASSCVDVEGATAQDYVLGHADAGERVRARVTATNDLGSASAVSEVSEPVRHLAPRDGSVSFAGEARSGSVLRAVDVAFDGTPPFAYSYRWLRCASGVCDRIGGASESTYRLSDEDVGQTVRLVVVATNPAGSAEASAASFSPVVAAAPVSLSAPGAPSGSARVGDVLEASDGEWAGTRPFSFTYVWQRCVGVAGACVAIPGASGRSYTLTSAELGRTVRVLVTAANEGNAPVGPVASGRSPVVPAVVEPEPEPEPDGDGSGGGGSGGGGGPASPPDPGPSPPTAPAAPAQPSAPAAPAPPSAPAAPVEDLSKIPGSLVAASKCKVVKANPRTKSARLRGVGRVTMRALVPARITDGAPLRLSLTAPKGKVRSVSYRAGTRRLGSAKRPPYALKVRPSRLQLGARQALVALVKPRRGRAKQVTLKLDVAPCPSLLTASVRFAGARAVTRVRVDSRFSIERVHALVPAALKVKGGKLTLTGLGGKRIVRLGAMSDGISVRRRGRKVTISGLPPGYGIAQLDLTGSRKHALKALRGRKPLRFSATLKAAGLGVQRLAAQVRPR